MTVGEHNLALLAEQAFAKHGDREAVFFDGRWYRSGDLRDRAHRLGSGLTKLGVKPGDRVAVMMPNSPDVGVVYQALWRAGAVITPLMFLLSEDEVHHALESSRATAVITGPEFADKANSAARGLDSVRHVATDLDDLLDEPGDITPRADSDLAALMFTGGTTGRSKGVMLTHENLWYCSKASYEASHVSGINRSLMPLPLAHSFGLIVTVIAMHNDERGTAALMRWFDPIQYLELIQKHQIQNGVVVPTMLQMLLAMPLEDYDLSSLRYLVSGAAPLPPEVLAEFERRVPSVEIREGYGLTESGAVISTNPPGRRKLGSVGKSLPGYEVRILNEFDKEVATGELGEIVCRSRGVMQGYWESPEVTAQTVRDGWLHTGDIGRLDEDGYLYIADRKKDLIIRGGFNVYPRDVEDALMGHPDVAMAGVVGRPDPKLGEEVVAFVSLKSGSVATEADLIDFAKSKLGAHKYPREIRILDLIPITPVGKVDRKMLRATLKEP